MAAAKLAGLLLLAPTLASAALTLPDGTKWGLKDAYDGTFKIGSSTFKNSLFLRGNTSTLLMDNYNVHLSEAALLWSNLEISEGNWNWDMADRYVDWSIANNIEPIGHCLIWKGIGWMSSFPPNSTQEAKAALYYQRMDNFINATMTRYKDRILRWVVINEFFNVTGDIRNDFLFPSTLGVDGISRAFQLAMKYGTPNMTFYMSENSAWVVEKYQKIAKHLKAMRKAGIKIDGMFMQGHIYENSGTNEDATGEHTHPSVEQYDTAIKFWGKNKFQVVLSEMDISVLPDGWQCCRNTSLYDYPLEQQKKLDPYAAGLHPDTAKVQRHQMKSFMKMLLSNRKYVTDVHFWGLADEYSWLNKWPIRGRTDYPTLFDRALEPKAMYYDLLRMAPNQPANYTIPNPPNPKAPKGWKSPEKDTGYEEGEVFTTVTNIPNMFPTMTPTPATSATAAAVASAPTTPAAAVAPSQIGSAAGAAPNPVTSTRLSAAPTIPVAMVTVTATSTITTSRPAPTVTLPPKPPALAPTTPLAAPPTPTSRAIPVTTSARPVTTAV